jgi:preprotein translocase subunit Sec63
MTSLEEIKQKLRSKGIKFDANKLKQGLVNQKHEPYDCGQLQCPEKRLLSNPLYKKFPL